MSDFEPVSQVDINFHLQDSKEIIQTPIPQALMELRNQREQKDFYWIEDKQETLIRQIEETIPPTEPSTKKMTDFDYQPTRSLYALAYDGNRVNATVSEWELGGGQKLVEAGFLEVVSSYGQVVEYKSEKRTPQDWTDAREIVLEDTFVKRHQELKDAIAKVKPTKEKYKLDIYFNPNKPEDKSIID